MDKIKQRIEQIRKILDTKKDEYGVLNYFEIQWYRDYYCQLLKKTTKKSK